MVLAVEGDNLLMAKSPLMALQLRQLVLFSRMSSPTLTRGSTWASSAVSMRVVVLLPGWVWGADPFRARSQTRAGSLVSGGSSGLFSAAAGGRHCWECCPEALAEGALQCCGVFSCWGEMSGVLPRSSLGVVLGTRTGVQSSDEL